MSAPKILSSGKVLAVLAGVGAMVALVYFLKRGATAVVDTAKVGLDPVNPNNFANSVVTHLGAGISGDPNWTLGGSIYDLFHPSQSKIAPRQALVTAQVKKTGAA